MAGGVAKPNMPFKYVIIIVFGVSIILRGA